MIVAHAIFNGQTYELCDEGSQPGLPYFWLGLAGEHPTPAAAVDALWSGLGITVTVEGWWWPLVDGLDISAAARPVTVTEQEMLLGDALIDELAEAGLGLKMGAVPPTRAHRALAHRQLRAHYEQLIAEELLEQVALAHDLECELIERGSAYEIVSATESTGPSGSGDAELLATGDTPLAAVLEFLRDLDAAERGQL